MDGLIGQHIACRSEVSPVFLLTLLMPEPWQSRVAAASEEAMGKQVRYFQRREWESSAPTGAVAVSSPPGSTGAADLQTSPSQLFTQLWPPFCHKPLLLKQQKSFLPVLLSLKQQC